MIYDVDFRKLVDLVPRGATFTMVADSCYSGGLIDDTVLSILSATSGMDASHSPTTASRRRPPARALFGADASAKYRRGHNGGGAACTDDDAAAAADAGILLRGCQADELSVEVPADDGGGRAAHGAFRGALQDVLAAHPAPMSNRELVSGARKVLGEQGFEQHPCLYCSDANVDAPFLGQQEDTKSN